MKKIKLTACLCVLIFFSLLPYKVQAKEEKGTIQIQLTEGMEGTKKEGVVFQYHWITDLQELETMEDAKKADEIANVLENQTTQYDGIVKTDREGRAFLNNMKEGVYLFSVKDRAGYERILPFLVSVPMWNEVKKEMDHEVVVYPKHTMTVNNTNKKAVAPQTGRGEYGKILCFIAAILFLFSLLLFAAGRKADAPYKKSKKESAYLIKKVVKEERKDPFFRKIDFLSLKKINPQIEGWLYIPGTNIDYPVLIGKDDVTYLRRDYRGKESLPGSVFSFADTDRNLLEPHICLFAHNMRSKQMFGELKEYKDPAFAKEHKKAYLYTPDKTMVYELSSVYECEKTDQTFSHKMTVESEEFYDLKLHMIRKNKLKINLPYNIESRQILTLSCCSTHDRKNKRMTVNFSFTCAKK